MMSIQDLFELGMKRRIPHIQYPRPLGEEGWMAVRVINLGAGKSPMAGALNLDLPMWDAARDLLQFADDESTDAIYAFHMLEHLPGTDVIRLLRDCQRVLRPGGLLTVVVPHRLGAIAYQDLDHRSFWTEETWKTLFQNKYYDKNGAPSEWEFDIGANFIMGIVERNLSLFTQLIRR